MHKNVINRKNFGGATVCFDLSLGDRHNPFNFYTDIKCKEEFSKNSNNIALCDIFGILMDVPIEKINNKVIKYETEFYEDFLDITNIYEMIYCKFVNME